MLRSRNPVDCLNEKTELKSAKNKVARLWDGDSGRGASRKDRRAKDKNVAT